jgi:hypothetical protein
MVNFIDLFCTSLAFGVIHPEDGNCSDAEMLDNFQLDAAYTRKPKLYIELQPRKPREKNFLFSITQPKEMLHT